MANIDAAVRALRDGYIKNGQRDTGLYAVLEEVLFALEKPSGKRTIEIDRDVAEKYISGRGWDYVDRLKAEIKRALEAK